MRFKLFARRLVGRGWIGTGASALFAGGLAGGLGVGCYLLFGAIPGIVRSPVWLAFALGLFCFLLSLFWVIWPVIAAQVDEAYELGRLLIFPVHPQRLYLIQTVVALLEPSTFFFYPALIGAGLGLSRTLDPGWLATGLLMVAFVLMNVATGRCLLNLFLNVMKSRRSGEILFAAFLVVLGLAAFLPPVDASWLFQRLDGFGDSPRDLALLANTARAIGGTPPGWLARGLAAAAAGELGAWVGAAAAMLAVGGLSWFVGLALVKRFYRGERGSMRHAARGREKDGDPRRRAYGWRLPGLPESVSAVFEKEVRTLIGNPKARMLFAVPFFLVILLKILGAPQLFLFLWGEAWASVLLTLLGFYLLSVLSGQFFSNGFGYDGPAVRLIYLFPAPPSSWLLGRNLAQGLFACVQIAGLWLVLYALVPSAKTQLWMLPAGSFLFGLFAVLGVGNLLSCRHPRRFHLTLARRDRPVGASFLWMLATLGFCTLFTIAALGAGSQRSVLFHFSLGLLPVLGAAVYRLLFPVAVRWMIAEKERLIGTLTR